MELVIAIVSKVGEYLVEPSINQVRYLFRFNKIVEDLKVAECNLKSTQREVEEQIKAAEGNDENIKATVQDWLSDSRKIMEEIETLKGKIEVNKTCLNGWCPNWRSRHQLGRKATKTSIRLKEIIGRGQFEAVGSRALLSGEPSAPKDFDLFGSVTDAFDKIMEALKNDAIHMVILHGMGGVGKTTLAKAVSKKVKEENIFKEVAMVTVSQTPNFRNIQGQLADFLTLELKEETEEGRAKRLLSRFSKSNNNLIILDDIWEEFNFEDKIGVPLSIGCKMLMTTRHKNVCTHREYQSVQSLIHLGVLKGYEGVALLKREAGIDDDCVNFNTLAARIAGECNGLPLALVTIGRYLRGKKDTEIWESVLGKLENSKLEDLRLVKTTERGVYASLKLSYDYLEGDKIRLCFLMCSLFPEDLNIPLEDLVRIGVGLDLYEGVSSIEEARRDLRLMVEALKALGLLLDAYTEEFVRMHDVVRDVALWITSKEENIFMSKSGMDLTQLSREIGWKQYTAISLLDNKLNELCFRLVCPKLKILLLGGEEKWLSYGISKSTLKVSDECFQEMQAVEVVSLSYVDLSLKSLQFLTNLKSLVLYGCDLRHISSLAKLNKLEILSFSGSRFDELPIELSELKELKMLDLRDCFRLKRIPSSLIRSFSQLEELYLDDIYTEREDEEKSTETGNARLSAVNYLSRLAVLHLKIRSKCLPKDFAFSELLRYDIRVNQTSGSSKSSKALSIGAIDATLLTALFKALFHSVEYLSLKSVKGCQNILPSIDQKGLKKLSTLEVEDCKDLKCMIDASQVGEENPELCPSLAKLNLARLPELQCIWKGAMPIHVVNFQSLTYVYVRECKSLAYLFTLSIARSLGQLKSLIVENCESLEFLIQIEEGDNGRGEKMLSKLEYLKIKMCKRLEYVFPVFVAAGLIQLKNLEIRYAAELKQVFHGKEENEVAEEGKDIKLHPSLAKLELEDLPELQSIWNVPMAIHIVNFKSLTDVYVRKLKSMAYLFTLSIARSLGQLKSLRVGNCESLKFLIKIEEADNGRGEKMLSKLEDLKVEFCKRLEYVFPVCVAAGLIQLKNLEIRYAAELKQVFHGKEENEVAEEGKDIKLPNLKKLTLYRLVKLTRFFPENNHSTWPALERFEIFECPNLTIKEGDLEESQNLHVVEMTNCNSQLCNEILSGLRCGFFKNCEVLRINNCGVKQVFQLEGQQHELSLPRLKSLELNHLEELECLCKGPDHVLRLENLTTLTIIGCKKLKHFFPFTVAQRLAQLESLEICDCNSLEVVISDDKEEIVVSGGEKNINLPKLKMINLERNANLKSFCPEKYHLTCPALEEFRIIPGHETSRFYKKGSRIMVMNDCSVQLCDEIFFRIRCGFFKKIVELSIQNCGVKEVFQLEGQQHELSLPQLKSLELYHLDELECLCKGPAHVLTLENLTTLTIYGCKKLKHIFPFTVAHVLRLGNLTTLRIMGCNKLTHIFPFTVAERLGQLESLAVWDCENLEQVVYLDHEREEYVGGGDHMYIVLPKLKYLHLKRLAKLVRFFPEKYDGRFLALEEFKIEDCYKLTTSFIGNEEKLRVLHVSNYSPLSEKILYQLRCGIYKTLEKLKIENSGIQVIFELGDLLKDGQEEELSLPPNLNNFQLHLLKNLTCLTIIHCNKLKHIFSSIVARNHQLQLKELVIRECGELEQIIDVKDGEEVGANLLQTLTYIEVEKCHKLKNLFPISIAPGFQKLEWLEVRDNSELEQIFGDNDVIDEKEIQLSQLQVMYLEDLPRLANFCPADYHFIFLAPPLDELKVTSCPKISTRFSWDEDNKSVHAEAKAPKIGREDEGHEETSTDLDCWDDEFIEFRKLPPYIKNEELYSNSHPTE